MATFTERQANGLRFAVEAYGLAFRLNDIPHLDGGPCQAAFETARQCLRQGFKISASGTGRTDAEVRQLDLIVRLIDEAVLNTSEYALSDLHRFAEKALAEASEAA